MSSVKQQEPQADVEVTFGPMSTVWKFKALTDEAQEWIEENVGIPDYMGDASAFCADWRMGRDIADGMVAFGLKVVKS